MFFSACPYVGKKIILGSCWYGNSKKACIYLFIKAAGRDFKSNGLVPYVSVFKRTLNLLADLQNMSLQFLD